MLSLPVKKPFQNGSCWGKGYANLKGFWCRLWNCLQKGCPFILSQGLFLSLFPYTHTSFPIRDILPRISAPRFVLTEYYKEKKDSTGMGIWNETRKKGRSPKFVLKVLPLWTLSRGFSLRTGSMDELSQYECFREKYIWGSEQELPWSTTSAWGPGRWLAGASGKAPHPTGGIIYMLYQRKGLLAPAVE